MNAPNQAPKKNVFISYRVSDTAGETGRLVDALKNQFEEDQIFMDIDKIEPGVDFAEVISRSLDSCDVMLAIIGPKWQGIDSQGQSRIMKPDDWVRLELSTALKRNIRVVPVLVDGAVLPDANDLPPDLEALTRRQSYEISNKRWRYDTDQLNAFLQDKIGVRPKRNPVNPPPQPPRPQGGGMNVWLKVGLGILSFLGLLVIIGLIIGEPEQEQPNQVQSLTSTTTDQGNNTTPVQKNSEPLNNATLADVNGTWVDPEGSIVQLRQSGNRLIVHLFSGSEQMGTGTGYVENGNIELSLNMLNMAMLTYHLQVSADNSRMDGNLTAEANGKSNTAVTWLVRSERTAE